MKTNLWQRVAHKVTGSLTHVLLAVLAGFLPSAAVAATVDLGTAVNFAVLGGTTVTNTGATLIAGGNVGVSPGASIAGFPPGVVTPPATIHAGDPVALQAQNDLTTAYDAVVAMVPTQDLSGQDLGGLTLGPGVYFFATSAQLTGTLTLDYGSDPDALFVFRIGTTLTTTVGSLVRSQLGTLIVCNLFWQVGSSATLGGNTEFAGNILALTSITLNAGAELTGRALARNGAVTLDTNAFIVPDCPVIPEPGSALLCVLALAAMLSVRRGRAS